MDAKTFLEEARRMCKAQDTCADCPIKYGGDACLFEHIPENWTPGEIERIVPIVEQWSEENPRKTRLEDLKRKHSHIPMINGYPPFAPRLVGYCGNIQTCAGCKQKKDSMHKHCWDQEVDENG